MQEAHEITSLLGDFHIAQDRQIRGKLSIGGVYRELYLWEKEPFVPGEDPLKPLDIFATITGNLENGDKVSLIGCKSPVSPSSSGPGSQQKEIARIFHIRPQYILQGNIHFSPEEDKVEEIRFVVEDAPYLLLDQVFSKSFETGKIRVEWLADYRIFAVETQWGHIEAHHNVSDLTIYWPIQHEVHVSNPISIALAFNSATSFDKSLARYHQVLRFLEVILGRSQNVQELSISPIKKKMPPDVMFVQDLQVYSQDRQNSAYPPYEAPARNLCKNVRELESVLAHWMKLEAQGWQKARRRFHLVFNDKGNALFRLVLAANMFELLPKKAFDCLSSGASLKEKIKCRAKIVTAQLEPGTLPHIESLIDQAVDCRNDIVHNTSQGNTSLYGWEDQDSVKRHVATLLYIFVASDLIESGWDFSYSSRPVVHWILDYVRWYPEYILEP